MLLKIGIGFQLGRKKFILCFFIHNIIFYENEQSIDLNTNSLISLFHAAHVPYSNHFLIFNSFYSNSIIEFDEMNVYIYACCKL